MFWLSRKKNPVVLHVIDQLKNSDGWDIKHTGVVTVKMVLENIELEAIYSFLSMDLSLYIDGRTYPLSKLENRALEKAYRDWNCARQNTLRQVVHDDFLNELRGGE